MSLVRSSRLTPVAVFRTVMSAPAIFPPLGSTTSPTMVALLVWASRAGINNRIPAANRIVDTDSLRDTVEAHFLQFGMFDHRLPRRGMTEHYHNHNVASISVNRCNRCVKAK